MARAYTAGDVLPFGIQVYDEDGDLANSDPCSLVVVLPDGTEEDAVTVTASSTGTYEHDYETATTTWGRYLGRWTTDGANVGGEPQAFFVLPAAPPITLGEAKSHLGVVTSNDDAEIASFIGAAIAIVAGLAGPIVPETRTARFNGGTTSLLLHHWPVTITTVTENGATVPASGYTLDDDSGILYRGSTTSAGRWAPGRRNIQVTYQAGTAAPSERVRMALKELLRYMWRQVHGNATSFEDGFISQAATSGVSAAMLDRVKKILGDEAHLEAGI